MSSKLTQCKSCGAEIAKSAKTCPQCGAKHKKSILGITLLVIGVLLILSALGGNSGKNRPQVVGNSPENTPQATEDTGTQETVFSVGETVELNDVIVTLNGVTETNGSQFNTPGEGNVFTLCEFTIENNSSKDLAISSLMCFTAYADGFSTNTSLTAMFESDKGQLDGTVAAGKKMNGVIGYEVPSGYKELEIRFTPDFWRGSDIIFVYTKDEA